MPYNEMIGASDDRPPQLNTAICGCRCGPGCDCGDREGGGSSDDEGAAARTQQTFDNTPNMDSADEILLERSFGQENTERASPLPFRGQVGIERIPTRYGGFIMSREGFRPDQFAEGTEAVERALLTRGFTAIHRVEAPSSTVNEPHHSDDHSSVSGVVEVIGVRCGSPGPGIGTWANYYFVQSPLRLTAQRKYCRGLVTAHLVVHDDMLDYEHGDSVFAK